MKRCVSLLLAFGLLCHAEGPKKKLSPDLQTTRGTSSVRIIVQWSADLDPATAAAKIAALGGTVISEFKFVHSGFYEVPSRALDTLEGDPTVKYVSIDRKVQKKAGLIGVTGITTAAVSFTPATINAPYAWAAGYTGAGIGVAIVDSGINQDDDLGTTQKPVYSEDFTVPPGTKPDSYGLDWYGHGQHIAGIIASNGKNSSCSNCTQTFYGIASGAALINLKVLDVNGEGSDSSVIAAINRAIALKDVYKIRVMNLSVGRPVYESYTQDPLCQAVEAAWKAGIVVVISAGNNGRDNSFDNQGYGTVNAPGNDPYVITVGAMKSRGTPDRTDDLIASYSSKGPTSIDHVVKPDILAPGNMIVSLLNQHATLSLNNPQNFVALAAYQSNAPTPGLIPAQPMYDSTSNKQPPAVKLGPGYSNNYFVLSGTSMAAAVVSGSVADLLQAAPGLTPDQVKLLLMQTASKVFPTSSTVIDTATGQIYTSYYDIFTVGAGYIDLRAALNAIKSVPVGATALSPVATYDPTTGDVELSFDPSSVFSNKAMWGASGIWAANGVWGSSVLSGNKAMWGANSVWGAATDVLSNKAMWGASALWGSKALWGASTVTDSQSYSMDGEQ